MSTWAFSDLFLSNFIEKYFLFALMWSIGSVLELDARERMQEFLLNHPSNFNWPKLKV